MPHSRFLLVLGFWLFTAAVSVAQPAIPIGQWRSHLPNFHARTLAQVGSRIYCGTSGGLFYYDTEDNSLQTLSKVEGLSDAGVEKIAHDTETNTTLIAYTNTNVDLIAANGRVYNLNDILRKQIIGNKIIRSIHFNNKLAYLSTSFGVVVIDLVKREVRNTYTNIGPSGRVIDVLSTTTLNDSIYIAAVDSNKYRIMRARISNNNLLDYANWKTFTSTFLDSIKQPIRNLAAYNNKVYATANHKGVFYFNGTNWNFTNVNMFSGVEEMYSLKVSNGKLFATTLNKVIEIYNPDNYTTYQQPEIQMPFEAIRTSANEIWIADVRSGLLKLTSAGVETIRPNGPYSTAAFDMFASNNKLYVVAGAYNKALSYTQTHNRFGFYVFADGEWTSYNTNLLPSPSQYPDVQDLVEVAQAPDGTVYLGSYGYGLIKWKGPGDFQVYNNQNSPLLSSDPNPAKAFTRISGLAIDQQGTVWVVNRNEKSFGATPSLFALKPNNEWEEHTIPFSQSGALEKLALDDVGNKWIIVSYNSAGGIVVYNDKTKAWRYLTNTPTGGRLPSLTVNSITKDLNGAMWIGTDNGVGVYYSPSQILQPTYNVEPRPFIGGRYLLENQVVNDIAVDGGNRKWIATEQGLWLFNETGTEQLAHFTTENSPLPLNKINKLAIDHVSGELFISTDAGIFSYRSGATITEVSDACKGVFPNPVRPGFTGTVGISGVPANAMVKITDLSGALVYEVKANGNTAVWDLRDYNGKRVSSGVYLIMSASADGTENFSCKVAVLD